MRELGPKGAETYRKIINTAITLFSQKGYICTSMEEIASKIGITKPAIYSYFASKQEILETIFTVLSEDINDIIKEQLIAASSLKKRLHRINSKMLQNTKDINIIWMLATIVNTEMYDQLPNTHLSHITEILNQLIAGFIDIFQKEKDLGRIRQDVNPRFLTFHFLAVANLYLMQRKMWLTFLEDKELQEFSNSFVDTFLNGISTE